MPQSPTAATPAGKVIATLALAGVAAAVMQTLVTPLLTDLPRILHTSHSNAAWVVTATLLVAGVCVPISGRLGDMVGKRRMLLACCVPLIAGSVVCALSGSVVPMIVGRGLQGIGMGMIPLGIALLRDILPAEKLSSSIALVSASMGIGGGIGLPLSAAVAQYANWRFLFWGAAALAAAVAVMIVAFVPDVPMRRQGSTLRRGRRAGPGGGPGVPAALRVEGGRLGLGLRHHPRSDHRRRRGPRRLGVVRMAHHRPAGRPAHHGPSARPADQPRLGLHRLRHVREHAGGPTAAPVPRIHRLRPGPVHDGGRDVDAPRRPDDDGRLPLGGRLTNARGPKVTLVCGALVLAAGYGVALLLASTAVGLMAAAMVINSGVALAYGAMPALVMSAVPPAETGAANGFNALMRSLGTSFGAAVVGVVLARMTTTAAWRHLHLRDGLPDRPADGRRLRPAVRGRRRPHPRAPAGTSRTAGVLGPLDRDRPHLRQQVAPPVKRGGSAEQGWQDRRTGRTGGAKSAPPVLPRAPCSSRTARRQWISPQLLPSPTRQTKIRTSATFVLEPEESSLL